MPPTLLAKIPTIPTLNRPRHLAKVLSRLRVLLDHAPRTRFLSVLKYTVYIVLLVNMGSLPFMWHIRVCWHLLVPRLEYWSLCLRLLLASKKERILALVRWGENLSPVGANPFEICTVYRRWATIDDIDMFGMHLSNSSYAKAFDSARAKAVVKCFPAWCRSSGQIALGATHYHFIREIPPFARYELRLTIGSWDHKWLYVVARYVTWPSRRDTRKASPRSTSTSLTPNDSPALAQNGSANVEHTISAIIQSDNDETSNKRRAPIVEPDGAILHCVAVSHLCFKQGRITVPPAIILACEGFTKPYGEDAASINGSTHTADVPSCSYSRTNPPVNWIKSQSMRVPPHGSMDAFCAFLRGQWRDVPEGERWWEHALGGSIEIRRQANLEMLDALKLGLDRARTLHDQKA